MRTTLTFLPDVHSMLMQVVQSNKSSLKSVVNDALRIGLKEILTPSKKNDHKNKFSTKSHNLGKVFISPTTNIGEMLSMLDEERS